MQRSPMVLVSRGKLAPAAARVLEELRDWLVLPLRDWLVCLRWLL